MKKLLFFVLIFLIHNLAFAVDSFSTLEERMSSKEFQETGLGKLSAGELAALNEWLRSHSVATLENVRSSGSAAANEVAGGDMRGLPNEPKDDSRGKVISGNIEGSFDGWANKGNLFKLTNGMIWQQVGKDSFYIEPIENAAITIEKTLTGKWHLSLVGHKDKVKVVRIQ
jgi:hypothetical protein